MKSKTNIFALIILLILSSACLSAQCKTEPLKEMVMKQISEDRNSLDTICYLFDATVGIDIRKRRGDKYTDTIKFIFNSGNYLRFYLASSANTHDNVTLVLLNADDMSSVIKRLDSNKEAGKVAQFDYYVTKTVWLYMVLNLDKNSDGCAFAAATQYKPFQRRPLR
jgi:outer membrane lipoprotein-sorting protein